MTIGMVSVSTVDCYTTSACFIVCVVQIRLHELVTYFHVVALIMIPSTCLVINPVYGKAPSSLHIIDDPYSMLFS
jgi:hypothetical protein